MRRCEMSLLKKIPSGFLTELLFTTATQTLFSALFINKKKKHTGTILHPLEFFHFNNRLYILCIIFSLG